jgi:hypothetical protein
LVEKTAGLESRIEEKYCYSRLESLTEETANHRISQIKTSRLAFIIIEAASAESLL